MKISYVSDTHGSFPRLNEEFDILIVAGDVSNHYSHTYDFLKQIKEVSGGKEVIFVPGNHDLLYSDWSFDESLKCLRELCSVAGVHMLYNDTVEIDGIKFYGTTLWSDLQSYGVLAESHLKRDITGLIADYQNQTWTVSRHLSECHKAVEFLLDAQFENYDGKKFVITHFSPSLNSVAEKYRYDILSAYFCNDMHHLTEGIDYWVHGHTHHPFDYNIGNCRVLCNPIGYRSRYGIENPLYVERIIEV